MVDRTTFVAVTDDDTLSQGYFNETGPFYVEHVDTSGADYTHAAASWSKEQTYTFSGLTTSWEIIGVELEGITLVDSSANGNDSSSVGAIVTDTSSFWALASPATSASLVYPATVRDTTDGVPVGFFTLAATSSVTTMNRMQWLFTNGTLTGLTSLDVEIYLFATQTAANTATLTKGFTVRLIVRKQPARDLATSTAQA